MLPVRLVSATRYGEPEFYEKSALGRCLRTTYGGTEASGLVTPHIFFNNESGLSACYNAAISSSSETDEILVFLHDDVFILDFFWLDTLKDGFNKFDLLGLAGNRRRVPLQPAWAFVDNQWTWDSPENLSGAVGYGMGFPCELTHYGPVLQECKLLDGVLLATKRSTLDDHAIRFDEQFTWHFYDLDICRQFEDAGLSMGTIPMSVIHESRGAFGTAEWGENYVKYIVKWKS